MEQLHARDAEFESTIEALEEMRSALARANEANMKVRVRCVWRASSSACVYSYTHLLVILAAPQANADLEKRYTSLCEQLVARNDELRGAQLELSRWREALQGGEVGPGTSHTRAMRDGPIVLVRPTDAEQQCLVSLRPFVDAAAELEARAEQLQGALARVRQLEGAVTATASASAAAAAAAAAHRGVGGLAESPQGAAAPPQDAAEGATGSKVARDREEEDAPEQTAAGKSGAGKGRAAQSQPSKAGPASAPRPGKPPAPAPAAAAAAAPAAHQQKGPASRAHASPPARVSAAAAAEAAAAAARRALADQLQEKDEELQAALAATEASQRALDDAAALERSLRTMLGQRDADVEAALGRAAAAESDAQAAHAALSAKA